MKVQVWKVRGVIYYTHGIMRGFVSRTATTHTWVPLSHSARRNVIISIDQEPQRYINYTINYELKCS